MKRIALLITLAALLSLPLGARNIGDFFVSEPDNLFELLPRSTRSDMVTYFALGQTVEADNRLGKGSKIEQMDSTFMRIRTSQSRTVEMLMLLKSKRDTVIAVIETLEIPQLDSKISFYDSQWRLLKTDKFLSVPTMRDFISPGLKKEQAEEAMRLVDIPVIYMTFTGDRHEFLSAQHQMSQYMTREEFARIAPYLRQEAIIYDISGAKFKRRK